jgi:predicted esterase
VTALGFSQGVATVARWATLGTERIDRAILWAATLPPELDVAGDHKARLETARLVLVVGTKDDLIDRTEIQRQREALERANISVRYIEFDGAHRLDDATLRELVSQPL